MNFKTCNEWFNNTFDEKTIGNESLRTMANKAWDAALKSQDEHDNITKCRCGKIAVISLCNKCFNVEIN